MFPQVSTVTYLTEGGAPTVVLDRVPDSFSGAVSSEPIDEAAACFPEVGRHLAFDGRKLHAAPKALSASKGPPEVRATFLVNCWLDHRPSGVSPFPEVALDKMSSTDLASFDFHADARRPAAPGPDERSEAPPDDADDAKLLSFPFSRVGTKHAVRLVVPSTYDATRAQSDGIVDLAAAGVAADVVDETHEEHPPPKRRRTR